MDVQNFFRSDEQPLETLLPDGGFCGIFRTITCVGDSLSSGEFQTQRADGTFRYHDMYEYSWGQYLARATGSTVYNMSRGGMSARELISLDEYWDLDRFPPTQAYVIALGVNDIQNQNQEVGTLADIQEDWRKNADTFAGHYAGVIQRINPGYICHALVDEETYRRSESRSIVEKLFSGSFGLFARAFMEENKLSGNDIEELKKIIEENK